MNNFFNDFNKVSAQEWREKLLSELKGADANVLNYSNSIEGIAFEGFQHAETSPVLNEIPGTFPNTRGLLREDNFWNNGFMIEINDETTANKKALEVLMMGADLLILRATRPKIDWQKVLKGIELEHIESHFGPYDWDDMNTLLQLTSRFPNKSKVLLDLMGNNRSHDIAVFGDFLKIQQRKVFVANGFGVQRIGGSATQEIAYALGSAHEYLVELIEKGLTADEAAACIHFRVGIDADFFLSIGKIRALRQLWSTIIKAYDPKHNCSYNCSITAFIGHSNKSLKDPYTNLLRQTTEALSALSAGVEGIVVMPYDYYSLEGADSLSERMALNIPLLLKEESYLDKVIDPNGGSYTIEQMTSILSDEAWKLFQELESKGGLGESDTFDWFRNQVSAVQEKRKAAFKDGEHKLIGVNSFPNPELGIKSWKTVPGYLGLNALQFEQLTPEA